LILFLANLLKIPVKNQKTVKNLLTGRYPMIVIDSNCCFYKMAESGRYWKREETDFIARLYVVLDNYWL